MEATPVSAHSRVSDLAALSCPGRKHKSSLGPSAKVLSQPRRNMVGCRIQHVWKEGGGHVIWKGTVLDQVSSGVSGRDQGRAASR